MNRILAGLVTAVATAASVVFAAPAEAAPSCISVVTELEPTTVGPLLSGLARQYQPLGPIIASEATSPHDACPPE